MSLRARALVDVVARHAQFVPIEVDVLRHVHYVLKLKVQLDVAVNEAADACPALHGCRKDQWRGCLPDHANLRQVKTLACHEVRNEFPAAKSAFEKPKLHRPADMIILAEAATFAFGINQIRKKISVDPWRKCQFELPPAPMP